MHKELKSSKKPYATANPNEHIKKDNKTID